MGQLYSLGSNDEGQLGRTSPNVSTPELVHFDHPIDMVAAGECHSLVSNSKNGLVYFWGVYRNTLKGKMGSPYTLPKKNRRK